MEHLKQETVSGAQLNMDALYQICPQCFTESKDPKTGEIKHAVDFEKLRLLLGDNVAEGDERYDFTWVGKRAALQEAAKPIRKTLRPCPEESVDWENTKNLYIEGDNLEVLKLLQNSYMGKVKMIYIDPPYNTGNDFVYHDDFHQTKQDYDLFSGDVTEEGERLVKNTESNGRFHSDWCSMIYSRLMVARNILSNDGAIFISIDDNEVENLCKICDEIFGESNFVSIINWRRSGGRQDSKYYAVIHEYIVCYAKSLENFEAGEEIKHGDVYPKYDEVQKRYYKTQLLRKWGSNSLRENRPNLYYPIKGPDGSDVYPIIYSESATSSALESEIQGRWRWGASTLEKARQEGRIEFQRNKFDKWVAYEKIFAPKEGEEKTKKYTTWIDDVGNGTDSIKKLFSKTVFDYSKSAELVTRFLKMANLEDGEIALDFFSGSGTTADAVMQLNAEDKGHRKFIMVQLQENTADNSEAYKAGYKNICEIGKERIRRAGKKILEEQKAKQGDLFSGDQIPLDVGFRVFKCADSNMKDVYYTPAEYSQELLLGLEDNIKEDRNDLDLLFGCMLDWGVTLDLPLRTEKVDGVTIHIVNDGDLVACFDQSIPESAIDHIASLLPMRVVLRDSCFKEAKEKMNFFEIFKQRTGWSEEEVRKNVKVI